MITMTFKRPFGLATERRDSFGPSWLGPIWGIFSKNRQENPMLHTDKAASDWASFTFDKEMVLNAIPLGMKTSAIHISVKPTPADGAVRVLGRMANGGTGSVTLTGEVIAAKLPFVDRTIRFQFLGQTEAVQVELDSFQRQ